MSMPEIPDLKPNVNVKRKDAVNLLLLSIALEELGLAHFINAEAEKLQEVLEKHCSMNELFEANEAAFEALKASIKKEMLLQFKFENILDLVAKVPPDKEIVKNIATAEGFYENEAYTDNDTANYNTVHLPNKKKRGDE